MRKRLRKAEEFGLNRLWIYELRLVVCTRGYDPILEGERSISMTRIRRLDQTLELEGRCFKDRITLGIART